MFASPVRIHTHVEAHVGAGVGVKNCFRLIPVKTGQRRCVVGGIPVGIAIEMNLLESICRIAGGAATFDRRKIHASSITQGDPVYSSEMSSDGQCSMFR